MSEPETSFDETGISGRTEETADGEFQFEPEEDGFYAEDFSSPDMPEPETSFDDSLNEALQDALDDTLEFTPDSEELVVEFESTEEPSSGEPEFELVEETDDTDGFDLVDEPFSEEELASAFTEDAVVEGDLIEDSAVEDSVVENESDLVAETSEEIVVDFDEDSIEAELDIQQQVSGEQAPVAEDIVEPRDDQPIAAAPVLEAVQEEAQEISFWKKLTS